MGVALHLAVCSFLAVPPDGATFAASEIPLHVTAMGNFEFAGESDAVVVAMKSVAGRLPIEAKAGADALFGPHRDVRVTLVADTGGIRELHDALNDGLRSLGCELDEPLYSGDGFRPHVTVVAGAGVVSGQTVRLESLSLIDLQPDRNSDLRRVLVTVHP